MSELEIITSAFSAQRLSKYVAYNRGNAEMTVKHYKSNLRSSDSSLIFFPFPDVMLPMHGGSIPPLGEAGWGFFLSF